jgi:prepilin-type N-terminal cleavage/methylation domain-containing protein
MIDRDILGFTVLEMLVALCILGLLSAYTTQSFFHMRRMDTVLDRIEKRSILGAVEQHLRNVISAARPVIISHGGMTTVAIEGDESQLQLIVASDGVLEQGGLLEVQIIARRRSDGSFKLMTRRAAYGAAHPISEGELVLLERIRSFNLRYYGQLSGQQLAGWHSQWRDQAALPRLVEVSIVLLEDRRSAPVRWVLQPAAAGM